MASNTAPPGYQWVESRSGGGGDDPSSQVYQYLAPIPGYVAPVTPPANTVGGPGVGAPVDPNAPPGTVPVTRGPNATIAANWAPTASTTAQLAALLTTPNSGYATNPNYGMGPNNVSPGRWQFSGTAPVPQNAPVGWGRYPGIDGSPASAPWLKGETMPPPRWGNFGPGGPPPVPLTPPPNTVGGGGVAPPGTTRNPYTTPGYTNATGTGGQTRVPITAVPPPNTVGTGRTPTQTGAPNQAEFLLPSQTVTGGTTVAQATGQNVRRTVTLPNGTRQWVNEVVPVDPKWNGYYIPPQYVGHALPGGAFTTLFPNSDGTGWVQTPPPGWGPNWRPSAAPRQLGG